MVVYKLAFILLPATFILTLFSHFSKIGNFIDNSIIFLYFMSATLAGKIILNRYNQIKSLSTEDKTIKFASTTSTLSSICLLTGFLTYSVLLFFEVDNYCLTTLSLFVCGFGTLYMWMQNIISSMMSSTYSRRLLEFRQGLVISSFAILVVMAACGTASIFFPIHEFGAKTGIKFSVFVINSCSYIVAAIFSVYLMSFEKDSKHMIDSNLESIQYPFDDECLFNNSCRTESESLFSHPNAILIKTCISSMKVS